MSNTNLSQLAADLMQDELQRENLPLEIFQELSNVISDWVNYDGQSNSEVDELTNCFRVLRNSCVNGARNQNEIMKLSIVSKTVQVLEKLSEQNTSTHHTVLLCGNQFLGNLIAGNLLNQQKLWKIIFPSYLKSILKVDSPKVLSAVVMTVYNCIGSTECFVDEIFQDESPTNIAISIIEKLPAVHDQDWVILCITEHFLKSEEFLPLIFNYGSISCKCSTLDVLSQYFETGDSIPPTHTATCLWNQFAKDCQDITAMQDHTNQTAMVTTKLLHTLCMATSSSAEARKSLSSCCAVEVVVDILRRVVMAGKLDKASVFAPAEKASPGAGAKEQCSPVAGFKRDLVRVIGNLCYRNPPLQNKVRELEGLPLILDSCNIDDNNPFIRQWAVFTIRNLCENNAENQAILSRLERHSVVENPIFQNSGLEVVESDDGHLSIKPST
uniref:Ataxin-10 n=1 Tax=Ciona intestinalis TaxID=7719 RepID=F6ZH72_CIOIN|nr:ataxin-10-like [Ciona intestinalis]|eukprot:XP_002122907.2 ataxin-10-like [Ciona intestinalis]